MSNRSCLQRHFLLIASILAVFIYAHDAQPAQAAIFNVRSYGATGNGTTDDTNSIQSAITAAGAGSGNTVFFPAGTYRFTQMLTATGLILRGDKATLLAADTDAEIAIAGSNAQVSGFRFTNTQSNITALEVLEYTTNFRVAANVFDGEFNRAILISRGRNGIVENNNIRGTLEDAIAVLVSSRNTTISNNVIVTGSAGNGILVHAGIDIIISRNRISCYTSTNGSGILDIHSHDSTIASNVTTNGIVGIAEVFGDKAQISSNRISNTVEEGIDVRKADYINVSDNILTNCGTTGVAAGQTAFNVTISNNRITACNDSGISAVDVRGYVNITSNTIRNCGLKGATAVIFADCNVAQLIRIADNTYTGNAAGLSYFIRCLQTSQFAQVSGNRTNTQLPTKIGP